MTRSLAAVIWMSPVAMVWGLLALVSRLPNGNVGIVANGVGVLALPLTYVAVLGAVVHASARRRLALMRVTAVTLGLLVALVLLEAAAAARLVHWELFFRRLRGEEQYYVPDPDLGFRHTPSTRVTVRPRSDIEAAWGLPASQSDRMIFTYDRRGYRNPTDLDRADIVLVGDSYVEGAYVSDDQTLSRFLQDRLGRSVANLGVAGYGTAQELVVLKMDAVPLRPHVVIWFFFEGNDLYNDHDFENLMLAPRGVHETGWTEQHGWWRRSLSRSLYAQLRLLLQPLIPGHCPTFGILTTGPHQGQKVLFGPEAGLPWTEFEQRQWSRAQEILRAAARITGEHTARLLLVYVPIKFRVYRDFLERPSHHELEGWTVWPLRTLFAQFCRDDGLTCLDLTGPLQDAVRRGSMPYALADSHWNAEGHQLIADWLGEILASRRWLPGAQSASEPGRCTEGVAPRGGHRRCMGPGESSREAVNRG